MRGGKREKKRIRSGEQALLAAIWELYGGPIEVSKKVSAILHEPLHPQAPVNWRIRGQVPHRLVQAVAQALNISPLGLNYATLIHLMPNPPAWEKVVRSYGLAEIVVQHILFLRPPGAKKKYGGR